MLAAVDAASERLYFSSHGRAEEEILAMMLQALERCGCHPMAQWPVAQVPVRLGPVALDALRSWALGR